MNQRSHPAVWRMLLAILVGFSMTDAAFGQIGQAGFDSTGVGAYGTNGKAFHALGGNVQIRASALQADQKLLLTGECGAGQFCVARLLRNGALDATFVGPQSSATGWFNLASPAGSQAHAIAVDSNGRILVGGACFFACVARLNSDGAIDSSWLGDIDGVQGGIATYSVLGEGRVHALLPQADGKVILVGSCKGGASALLFCIARLNTDGSLDSAFGGVGNGGGNGWAATSIGSGGESRPLAAAQQSDGSIVMVGECKANTTSYRFCVARYNSTGALDATFGGASAGRFFLNILATSLSSSFEERARSVLIQGDGKLVLLGTCLQSGNYDFCGVRLTPEGSVDNTFTGPFGLSAGRFGLPISSAANDFLEGAAIQPDGRLLLVGSCDLPTGSRFCAARLLTNGKLDTSFAGTNIVVNGPNAEAYVDGRVTLAPSLGSFATGGAQLQSDGKILLAGRCVMQLSQPSQACVVRLRGQQASADLDLDNVSSSTGDGLKFFHLLRDPALRDERLFDIDGDGVIDETDALVFARALSGFVGSGVTAGIVFAPNATRRDWDSIRTYLVNVRGLALP